MRLGLIFPLLFIQIFCLQAEAAPSKLSDAILKQLYVRAKSLVADQFGERLDCVPGFQIADQDHEAPFPVNADYNPATNTIRFFKDGFMGNYEMAFGDNDSQVDTAALLVMCHELVHAYQHQHGLGETSGMSMEGIVKNAMLESHAVFVQSRIADVIGAAELQVKGVEAFRKAIEGLAVRAPNITQKTMMYVIIYRYVFGPSLYQAWFDESNASAPCVLQEQFNFASPKTPHFSQYALALEQYISQEL